ncbi:MAG: SdpI family protein [Chitinophagales bacterium]|nr:SdpI family protein [Chitinophagales bacterium]OJV24268.1 MAG: hypothetical protein BGO32_04470 [Bacteroidetes bacterium 37-13]HRN94708.1 SdpI family protein [Chitinophagales bacterium]HRP39269.1 SdpI family protein [Chitinophagales bacterium]
MNSILLLNVILLIVSFLYWLFPPKKVNWFYGYRTPTTMRSDAVFELSNKIASRYFLLCVLACSVVSALLYFLFHDKVNEYVYYAVVLLFIVVAIALTEREIKKQIK